MEASGQIHVPGEKAPDTHWIEGWKAPELF